MSEDEFIYELSRHGISLSNNQVESFRKYAEFLLEYNQHTNLTAIRNIEDVYLKHFYDSIIGLNYFEAKGKTLLDIGSGAGFPGVVLKIVEPTINLTLLDSNGKKTKFLDQLSAKLDIEFEVINDRAEKYVSYRREYYDIVTGRAVTAMPVLAELSLPFVKVGGLFIAYKGQLDDTIENGLYAIEILGGEVLKVSKTLLPREGSVRTFVVVNKKRKTDDQFPRNFDKINKKPLQKS